MLLIYIQERMTLESMYEFLIAYILLTLVTEIQKHLSTLTTTSNSIKLIILIQY